MVGIELASAIIIIETIVAILLIHNAEKNARCSECQHCLRLAREEEAEKQKNNHMNYHYWVDGFQKICNDNDCPGLDKPKRKE